MLCPLAAADIQLCQLLGLARFNLAWQEDRKNEYGSVRTNPVKARYNHDLCSCGDLALGRFLGIPCPSDVCSDAPNADEWYSKALAAGPKCLLISARSRDCDTDPELEELFIRPKDVQLAIYVNAVRQSPFLVDLKGWQIAENVSGCFRGRVHNTRSDVDAVPHSCLNSMDDLKVMQQAGFTFMFLSRKGPWK